MADDIDIAVEIGARALERSIAVARAPIPAGEPGECHECERYSPRLVRGRCAPCRDGRGR